MRILLASLLSIILISSLPTLGNAQTAAPVFTLDLSVGASGSEVTSLQQLLNTDPDTRVAAAGPGSPGNETEVFGPLTRAAVLRFQEKYAGDILAPIGLIKGSGRVGSYTRKKLNALRLEAGRSASSTPSVSVPSTNASSTQDFLVKESEKADVYTGDRMLFSAQSKITAAINAAVASRAASRSAEPIKIPAITEADVPSVSLSIPAPRFGLPGTKIFIKGRGIVEASVVYFGNKYLVRSLHQDSPGNFSFVVPPIPPGRYDIAVRTGGVLSNTSAFVVMAPGNPPVHLESVSPATLNYGDTLTIVGSGFSRENNQVVTTYQTFTDIPSADGTTLIVRIAPPSFEEIAKVSGGKVKRPMSVYVVSDYGFSDSEKSFVLTL